MGSKNGSAPNAGFANNWVIELLSYWVVGCHPERSRRRVIGYWVSSWAESKEGYWVIGCHPERSRRRVIGYWVTCAGLACLIVLSF